MKRPIKFRGHNFFTKEPVYSQTIQQTDDGWDFWFDDWIHCTDCVQLVGVDSDGNEVYEGDRVISAAGYEYTAGLHVYPNLNDYRLKGTSNESA